MTSLDLGYPFEGDWAATSKSCLDRLEPVHRLTARKFQGPDDIITHITEEPGERWAPQNIRLIRLALANLKEYSDFCISDHALDTSAFWGLQGLLLTVSLPSVEVSQGLVEIGRKCLSIRMSYGGSEVPTRDKMDVWMNVFVPIMEFFTNTIKILTQDGNDKASWQAIHKKFSALLSEIDGVLSRVHKMIAIRDSQDTSSWLSFQSIKPGSFRDVANLPCFILPSKPYDTLFGREDVLEKIEDHFKESFPNSLRSLALYGIGGVGKTCVAREYAEIKLKSRELDAIFWVQAEVHKSYSRRWLIIYDNAEGDDDTLRDYWPLVGSNGQALITTQDHTLALEPARRGIEVGTWDPVTGSKVLLHLLSRGTRMSWSIAALFRAFDISDNHSSNPLTRGINNSNNDLSNRYKRSLVNSWDAWDHVYQKLSSDSTQLLSFFSTCDPDDIPMAFLDLASDLDVPNRLQLYQDELRISKATKELLRNEVVARDKSFGSIYIHRFTQECYLRFMNYEDRQQAFYDASELLYYFLPKRSTRLYYDAWEQGKRWLPHALRLKDMFQREKEIHSNFRACTKTCLIWQSCQRLLLEQNYWSELDSLVTVTESAINTLPPDDPDLWMLSVDDSELLPGCNTPFRQETSTLQSPSWGWNQWLHLVREVLPFRGRRAIEDTQIELGNISVEFTTDRNNFLKTFFDITTEEILKFSGIRAYCNFLEEQFQPLMQPPYTRIWTILGLESPSTSENRWILLNAVAGALRSMNKEASMDDLCRAVSSAAGQKRCSRVMEPHVLQAVFSTLCWLTMMFNPLLQFASPNHLQPSLTCIYSHLPGGPKYQKLHVREGRKPLAHIFNIFMSDVWDDFQPHRVGAREDDDSLYGRSLNFYTLHTSSRISIEWVDTIGEHLKFDPTSRQLSLFRFPTFCVLLSLRKSKPPIIDRLEKEFSPLPPEHRYPKHMTLEQEILLSYRLLFGQSRRSRSVAQSLFDNLERSGRHFDHLLRVICDKHSIAVRALPSDIWSPLCRDARTNNLRESKVYSAEADFPRLGYRLIQVQKFSLRQEPSSLKRLWRDRGSTLQWYTFWAALWIGGGALLLAAVQVALQVVQIASSSP